MTLIRIVHDLPFVVATIRFNGQERTLQNVLLDTGSAGTLFKTDILVDMGYEFDLATPVRSIVGVGGKESVLEITIEAIQVGDLKVAPMIIEIGALEYDLKLDGVLGLDFLLKTRSTIDLDKLELRAS